MSDQAKAGKVVDAELQEDILAWLHESLGKDSGVLLADGFEDAFIGIGEQFNTPVAVYDREECLNVLMRQGDMTFEEAEEFFQFNVVGAYVGKQTPIFLTPYPPLVDDGDDADDADGYEKEDWDGDENDDEDDDEGAS